MTTSRHVRRVRIAAVAVASVATACGGLQPSASAAAEPASTPGVATAWTRLLAVGDFGVGGSAQRATGTSMRNYERTHPARVLVTLGDNDYTESPSKFRENWLESFGWLKTAGVSVAGTLGNHDVAVARGRYEFALLGMPRAYYTRRVGSVQLFLLDSTRVDTTQTRWLRRVLARSRARWKVAAFHHPPYTCGHHHSHARVQEGWIPLFERYGVQLVLSGHDHNYQRFAARRGLTYVVHGGGGAGLYDLGQCPAGHPRLAFARSTRGFLYMIAKPNVLRVRAVGLTGEVLDRFDVYP